MSCSDTRKPSMRGSSAMSPRQGSKTATAATSNEWATSGWTFAAPSRSGRALPQNSAIANATAFLPLF